MITKEIDILKKTRQHLLNFISDLSVDELNKIPAGFNNNIIWNVAHIIAAQQGVCYMRGGLPLVVKEDLFLSYKPDTKPTASVDIDAIANIKSLLIPTIDQMETDYNNGLFNSNPEWTNRYGVVHNNINDTIKFLLFHDGLHLGYVMALKRSVKK